jgi:hypothetical protein
MRFHTNTATMPVPSLEKRAQHGLGFDMEDDRRQSASDDSTLEIATPTHVPKGTFLVFGDEVTALHEPVLPLVAAFQKSSPDTSPPTRRGSDETANSDGEFLSCTDDA